MWRKKSIHVKSVTFIDDESMGNAGAVLNASIFYWRYIVFSNCRDLVKREIDYFPLSNLKLRLSGLYKQFNRQGVILLLTLAENHKGSKADLTHVTLHHPPIGDSLASQAVGFFG